MDIYEEIVKLQRAGHKGAVATIVNVRGSIPSFKSAKMLVRDDGTIAGTIGGGSLDICIEPVLPPPVLYIFGAGHVGYELYKAAGRAGFDVIVTDDRDAYANRERFPEAREVIAEDFDKALSAISPNESSYIVIVTRGHRDDMRVLRWAVQTQAKYIGMVGSRRKAITVFRELTKEGLKPELFERVHSPVGLDIGAISPEADHPDILR